MPFDQAKQNFETQTKEVPKKVDAGWAEFKSGAINYFQTKQKQISSFVDGLDYEGKENDKETYQAAMFNALDNLVDGDEATKKEMAEYRLLLKQKSEQLKNKLFYEKEKLDIQNVKNELQGAKKSFETRDLKVDLDLKAKAYLAIPKNERIDLKTININMQKLLGKASVMPPQEIKKAGNILDTVFNHYCLGNVEKAKAEAAKLEPHIILYEQHSQLLDKTGFIVHPDDFKKVFVVMIQSGAKPNEVTKVLAQKIQELRKIDGKNFDKLANGMDSKALSIFLINLTLDLSGGKNSVEKIKLSLDAEVQLKAQEKEVQEALKFAQKKVSITQEKVEAHQRKVQSDQLKISGKRDALNREISRVKKLNKGRLSEANEKDIKEQKKLLGEMETNQRVAEIMQAQALQAEITENTYQVVNGQSDLMKVNIKRSILSGYLNKPQLQFGDKTSKTVASILKLQDGAALKFIAEDKEFNAPRAAAQTNLQQAFELKASTLKIEVEKNKWLQLNSEKYQEINKALEEFYGKGILSENNKALLKEQFLQHGERLNQTLDDTTAIEQDEAQKFQNLSSKYKKIEEIPKTEIAPSYLQLHGYSQILRQMHSTTVKYIGQLESSLVLASPSEKDAFKKQIKESRAKIQYLATQIQTVDKFCGIDKGKIDETANAIGKEMPSILMNNQFAKDMPKNIAKLIVDKQYAALFKIDGVVESPLFGPVIQQALSPYISKMASQDQRISDAFSPINSLGARLQRDVTAYPRNWSFYYGNAIGEMLGVKQNVQNVRKDRQTLRKDVVAAINETPKDMPASLVARRKQYFQKFLDQIDETLNSDESPLSLASIKKIDEGISEIQNEKNKYRNQKFATGMVQTAIMAISIVAAVGGGMAAAALASKIGMVTTVGTVGLSAFGAAIGQVAGQKGITSAFQATGIYDFGGYGKIWGIETLKKDFFKSYLLSLAFIGAGKGMSSTLKAWAKAPDFLYRARFARKSLSVLKNIKGSLTGTKGLQAGLVDAKELTAWQRFWMEVGEEGVEETTENIAEKIDPRFGAFVSLINATDGTSIDSVVTKTNATELGIKFEGDMMTYSAVKATDFVANLNANLKPKLAKQNAGNKTELTVDTSIDPNGVVTVFMTKYEVDYSTGSKKQVDYKVQKIYPGIESIHLTPQSEAARIHNVLETGKNEYKVMDKHATEVLAQFQGRGFLVLPNESGTGFIVAKGETRINLQIGKSKTTLEQAQAFFKKNADSLKKTLNVEKYRNAWKSFVDECNGSYETFLKKHPRLAQHLPVNLQEAMQKVAVVGVAALTGMPAMMGITKSVSANAKISEHKPTNNGELKVYENEQALSMEKLMVEAESVRDKTVNETLDVLGVKGEQREVVMETFFDKKTGLLNRNGLVIADAMLKEGKKVSFLSYDADHMKANNEIKGEAFGDKVIELVGKSKNQMVSDLRSQGYDVYGVRMGGEEIVVFGVVPKEVLHKAEVKRVAILKEEIRSTLTSAEIAKMAEFIAKSKYTADEAGYQKAHAEIGGSTAAVVEVDGGNVKNYKDIAKKAVMHADAFLERAKNKTGRGQIILDQRPSKGEGVIDERRSLVENFTSKNELGEAQNANLSKKTVELTGKAINQFNSRLKTLNSLNLTADQRAQIETLLKSPKDTDTKVSNLLRRFGVAGSDVELHRLNQKLQNEYFEAIRDHGNYTGASTMLYLEKQISSFKGFERQNVRNLEIGEFKSVNETLGHTGGDAFLTYVYQDVIKATAKGLGIADSQIIIAQKGSNFRYVIASELIAKNPSIQEKFQRSLESNYRSKLNEFMQKVDAGSKGKSYAEIRAEWIRKNKQDTVEKSLKDQNEIEITEVVDKK
ncbi:diguanylate cyclase [Patescibacteria group bacterium]|nr:diguanylate cyclase [Patescibacteria group bacterium]